MGVRLAAAARHAGQLGALRLHRMPAARLRLFRLLPVLVARARPAEALRLRVLLGRGHGSPVLLIALMVGVLLDVAVPPLLGEVFRRALLLGRVLRGALLLLRLSRP